jgi:hypothetical protein
MENLKKEYTVNILSIADDTFKGYKIFDNIQEAENCYETLLNFISDSIEVELHEHLIEETSNRCVSQKCIKTGLTADENNEPTSVDTNRIIFDTRDIQRVEGARNKILGIS